MKILTRMAVRVVSTCKDGKAEMSGGYVVNKSEF
jgi:hypothetical protein